MNPTRKVKKPKQLVNKPKQVVKKPKQVVKKPKPIKKEGGGRRRIPLVATQTRTRRTTTASKTAYDDTQMPIPERNLMLRMPNQPPTRKTTTATASKPDRQTATALWRFKQNKIPPQNTVDIYNYNAQYQRQLLKAKEEEKKLNEAYTIYDLLLNDKLINQRRR
jgi:hypothetical protein